MTDVKTPSPSLHAGARAVTSAYSLSSLIDYGNERAAERDTFWQVEIDRLKRINGAELVEFLGIDPVSITAGAHHPMIPDSWRFGFVQPDGSLLRFQRMDAGPLVAWEAVARFIEQPPISTEKREPTAWISPRELEALRSNRAAFVTPGGSDTDTPLYGE